RSWASKIRDARELRRIGGLSPRLRFTTGRTAPVEVRGIPGAGSSITIRRFTVKSVLLLSVVLSSLLAVPTTPRSSHSSSPERTVLSFHTMYGVDGAFV